MIYTTDKVYYYNYCCTLPPVAWLRRQQVLAPIPAAAVEMPVMAAAEGGAELNEGNKT